MQKELVMKITSILQAIPEHAEWNIEIIDIQPVIDGLYIVYRNSDDYNQRAARLIEYCNLLPQIF